MLTLQRPCPACGNSAVKRVRKVYAIPEFEVLECRECDLTFINRVVNDNRGFPVEVEVVAEPALAAKAAKDFRDLKQNLRHSGVADFRGYRLLDVGCGIGTFLEGPKREGWEVAGLELSLAAAAYACEKRGMNVLGASIESPTGLPSCSFDVMTLFGVIEHLANPRGALAECLRLLKPGGFLVLQTPTEDGLIRRVGRVLYAASGGYVRFHVPQLFQMGGGHSLCFNRRSLRRLLEQGGFDVLSMQPSTYGLRVLLKRFEGYPAAKRWVNSFGTTIIFSLGRIMRASNHLTAYAIKRAAAQGSSATPAR